MSGRYIPVEHALFPVAVNPNPSELKSVTLRKLYLSLCLALLCIANCFGQVPLLNSYPEASAVIFLDFDGHYVTGSSWNWNGPFSCGPANLNETQINEVFSRIAEDYRPFNVNVTTDSVRFFAAHHKRRTRVIFTVTNEWYGSGAGGVASTGSFARGDNTPCFVFTKLHRYHVKNIAEAGSHEVGHTLGLRHQAVYDDNCVRTSDYNAGTGSGETAWAPIMGLGYNRNFTVWHQGTNSINCNTVQNDLEVITNSTNGLGYRPDDHADVAEAATPIQIADTQFVVSGIIAQSADKDLFTFSLKKAAAVKLDARPYSVGANNNGSNLDMRISLLDAAQQVLGTYNPTPVLSSFADTVLTPGTYYLKVEGTGNLYASSYGSLGAYAVHGSLEAISVLPQHRLLLEGNNQNGQHQLKWAIDAEEQIIRQVLEASVDGSYFSMVGELAATDRQWQQLADAKTPVQYRLRVRFSSGREYFSNTLVVRNASLPSGRPRLAGNLVNGSSVMMTSPVPYQFEVSDMMGKVLVKGKAQAGSTGLATHLLPAGMYLVKFRWSEGEIVEKLVKN